MLNFGRVTIIHLISTLWNWPTYKLLYSIDIYIYIYILHHEYLLQRLPRPSIPRIFLNFPIGFWPVGNFSSSFFVRQNFVQNPQVKTWTPSDLSRLPEATTKTTRRWKLKSPLEIRADQWWSEKKSQNSRKSYFVLIFDIIDPFFTFILYQYQYGCYAQDRDDHSSIPIFYTLASPIMEQSWVVSRSIPIATLMVFVDGTKLVQHSRKPLRMMCHVAFGSRYQLDDTGT